MNLAVVVDSTKHEGERRVVEPAMLSLPYVVIERQFPTALVRNLQAKFFQSNTPSLLWEFGKLSHA